MVPSADSSCFSRLPSLRLHTISTIELQSCFEGYGSAAREKMLICDHDRCDWSKKGTSPHVRHMRMPIRTYSNAKNENTSGLCPATQESVVRDARSRQRSFTERFQPSLRVLETNPFPFRYRHGDHALPCQVRHVTLELMPYCT